VAKLIIIYEIITNLLYFFCEYLFSKVTIQRIMTHTSFSAPVGAVIGLPLAVREILQIYSKSFKNLI